MTDKKLMKADLIDGALIVDKPQEWTSHDVCAFMRKKFNLKKIGHAGTLDPLATGVLLILIGQATKKQAALMAGDKEYSGVMELGLKTATQDRTGEVLDRAAWQNVTLEQIREHAATFVGTIEQMPPMVSAIKKNGVRLYELARRGLTVERDKRMVTVHYWDIRKMEGPHVHFSCSVSKGTYLRTLVHDLGDVLGCFATLAELRRIRSGAFHLDKGWSIDAIRKWSLEELRTHMTPLSLLDKAASHASLPKA